MSDEACPCGVNHTRDEHGYDPDEAEELHRFDRMTDEIDNQEP